MRTGKKSSNYNERAKGASIKAVVLHYTGMETVEMAHLRLCDCKSRVSAHYLIEESGICHLLVDETKRAWHAGQSYWRGERDMNSVSIGIELANLGHDGGLPAFPKPQMQALSILCQEIFDRHPIDPLWVLGHSDIAPDRKRDPGENFNWPWLAQQGIGIWPRGHAAPVIEETDTLSARLHQFLDDIGYDPDAKDRIVAFQRRFRPQKIDNCADEETVDLAASLLRILSKSF